MVSTPLDLQPALLSPVWFFGGPMQLVFPICDVVHAHVFSHVHIVVPFLRSICTCMVSSTRRAFRRCCILRYLRLVSLPPLSDPCHRLLYLSEDLRLRYLCEHVEIGASFSRL